MEAQSMSLSIPSSAIGHLQQLAKALDLKSPRNYAMVIGIADGRACVTDGFGLIELPISSLDGYSACSLKPDMTESAVKFPNWRQAIASTEAPKPEVLDANEIFLLLSSIGAVPRAVKNNLRLCFTPAPMGYAPDWKISLKASELQGQGYAFNPLIIKKFMKALPTGSLPESATIHGDTLRLKFSTGHMILVYMIQPAKEKTK